MSIKEATAAPVAHDKNAFLQRYPFFWFLSNDIIADTLTA
jgi:hypothetical protein